MKVVIVGDLAWKGRYHLGDEAMSEVALQELVARGADITFIAGDPRVTSEFYGVKSVPRFGFGSIRSRSEKEQLLARLLGTSDEHTALSQDISQTLDAIHEADAIIIAGGGNLNSIGIHHVYERLAVTRLAAQRGIPLYVTSQTVGPHLNDSERPLIKEIASYAKVFGVREASSAALMRAICGEDANIVRTLDDAVLLQPAPHTLRTALPEKFAVASFTFHARTTGLHEEEYYSRVASMLNRISDTCDVDILLLPHMSTFERPNTLGAEDDKYGHDRIQSFSSNSRIHSLPLVSAREVLSITSRAQFSVSTRYHPIVFGAAVGVPAIALVTSYYSAIRMRGALNNVGMESFAIPFEYWSSQFSTMVLNSINNRLDEFREHISKVGNEQKQYQSLWWDALYSSIEHGEAPQVEDFIPSQTISWASELESEELSLSRVAQESTNIDRLNAQLAAEVDKLEIWELKKRIAQIEARFNHLSTQELPDIRHRLRPPGANLRDRISHFFKRRQR